MKITDFRRLQKMMELTFSESDGEALNAIRAANKIVNGAGVDWNRIFNRLVTLEVEEDPDTTPPPDRFTPGRRTINKPPGENLDKLFEDALDGADGTFRDFLLDVHAKWTQYGRLTPKQKEAVEKAAYRTRRGREE